MKTTILIEDPTRATLDALAAVSAGISLVPNVSRPIITKTKSALAETSGYVVPTEPIRVQGWVLPSIGETVKLISRDHLGDKDAPEFKIGDRLKIKGFSGFWADGNNQLGAIVTRDDATMEWIFPLANLEPVSKTTHDYSEVSKTALTLDKDLASDDYKSREEFLTDAAIFQTLGDAAYEKVRGWKAEHGPRLFPRHFRKMVVLGGPFLVKTKI